MLLVSLCRPALPGIPAIAWCAPTINQAARTVPHNAWALVLSGEFVIGRVIKAMSASWHPQCFLCELCGVCLADQGFIKNAGRFVHAKVVAFGGQHGVVDEPVGILLLMSLKLMVLKYLSKMRSCDKRRGLYVGGEGTKFYQVWSWKVKLDRTDQMLNLQCFVLAGRFVVNAMPGRRLPEWESTSATSASEFPGALHEKISVMALHVTCRFYVIVIWTLLHFPCAVVTGGWPSSIIRWHSSAPTKCWAISLPYVKSHTRWRICWPKTLSPQLHHWGGAHQVQGGSLSSLSLQLSQLQVSDGLNRRTILLEGNSLVDCCCWFSVYHQALDSCDELLILRVLGVHLQCWVECRGPWEGWRAVLPEMSWQDGYTHLRCLPVRAPARQKHSLSDR